MPPSSGITDLGGLGLFWGRERIVTVEWAALGFSGETLVLNSEWRSSLFPSSMNGYKGDTVPRGYDRLFCQVSSRASQGNGSGDSGLPTTTSVASSGSDGDTLRSQLEMRSPSGTATLDDRVREPAIKYPESSDHDSEVTSDTALQSAFSGYRTGRDEFVDMQSVSSRRVGESCEV